MRFPLLLVLVIVVLGVLWYVMSGRSVSRRAAPSRHEPVLPSQRSDHGLNVPLTSAGGGLAAQSASEPSFGGAHTPIDEDRPATVSWDRDARDEDELMTDEPGNEAGGGDASATQATTSEVDGGDSGDAPVEADGDHPHR